MEGFLNLQESDYGASDKNAYALALAIACFITIPTGKNCDRTTADDFDS